MIPRHDRLDVIAEISVETQTRRRASPHRPHPSSTWPATSPSTSTWCPAATPGARGLAELGRTVVNGAGVGRGGRPARSPQWVGQSLTYTPGATKVDTSIDEVVERRVGVCQDYAHLTVGLCRAVGVPARYVSGYLFARRDDAGARRGDEDGEADSIRVQTHAWVEVAVAPGRWQPLDPTNGRDVGERHVKIGHGRDYFDVTPFHGSFSGSADPTLVSSVDIRRRSGEGDRLTILSAADRGLLRRPARTPPSGSPPTRNSRSNSSSSPPCAGAFGRPVGRPNARCQGRRRKAVTGSGKPFTSMGSSASTSLGRAPRPPRAGHQDLAGLGQVDQAGGQVHHRAVVVAVPVEHLPGSQADPDGGQVLGAGEAGGERAGDAQAVGHLVGHEHDLVADELHHLAAVGEHDVADVLVEGVHDHRPARWR